MVDGVQFHGSICSSLVIGVSALRARTSVSHACGSISLSLAVYADRRTMPNACFGVDGTPPIPVLFRRETLVDSRYSSDAQRAFKNSRSRSFGRNRSAFARSHGFSFASVDSSVRGAHEDRSASFASLRGPTTEQ